MANLCIVLYIMQSERKAGDGLVEKSSASALNG